MQSAWFNKKLNFFPVSFWLILFVLIEFQGLVPKALVAGSLLPPHRPWAPRAPLGDASSAAPGRVSPLMPRGDLQSDIARSFFVHMRKKWIHKKRNKAPEPIAAVYSWYKVCSIFCANSMDDDTMLPRNHVYQINKYFAFLHLAWQGFSAENILFSKSYWKMHWEWE